MPALKKQLEQVPFLITVINGWRLASKGFDYASRRYKRKQQWKVLFHASRNPKFASEWFKTLESSDFKTITENRPRLYIKPFRVYMSTRWKKQQRIKVILDTYRYMLNRGGAFRQVISKQSLDFVSFKLKDDIECSITLGYDFRYRKEGELVFSLRCEQLGGVITACAFSFEELKEQESWICRIGCVQGHRKNDLYSTKEVQKLLFGLRPKAFIVFVVQEFAKQLGFSAILGAGDAIQAYRQKHAIHLPFFHSIQFDYNTFWAEIGGHEDKDGWYKLPAELIRKDIKDLKTSKRATYRRRYEQLDVLSLQIEEAAKQF